VHDLDGMRICYNMSKNVSLYEKIVKYNIHRKFTVKTLDFFGKEVIILFSTRGTRVLTE
jgi:hypothetical protein